MATTFLYFYPDGSYLRSLRRCALFTRGGIFGQGAGGAQPPPPPPEMALLHIKCLLMFSRLYFYQHSIVNIDGKVFVALGNGNDMKLPSKQFP